LRILHLLTHGELCVCEIMRVLEVPQSTVSRHMAYLKNSGWVTDKREGVWVHYALATPSNPVHESLLRCVRECFASFPSLERDVERLGRVMGERECAP
jgi:ArsR family transcriptional regulator